MSKFQDQILDVFNLQVSIDTAELQIQETVKDLFPEWSPFTIKIVAKKIKGYAKEIFDSMNKKE